MTTDRELRKEIMVLSKNLADLVEKLDAGIMKITFHTKDKIRCVIVLPPNPRNIETIAAIERAYSYQDREATA